MLLPEEQGNTQDVLNGEEERGSGNGHDESAIKIKQQIEAKQHSKSA